MAKKKQEKPWVVHAGGSDFFGAGEREVHVHVTVAGEHRDNWRAADVPKSARYRLTLKGPAGFEQLLALGVAQACERRFGPGVLVLARAGEAEHEYRPTK